MVYYFCMLKENPVETYQSQQGPKNTPNNIRVSGSRHTTPGRCQQETHHKIYGGTYVGLSTTN